MTRVLRQARRTARRVATAGRQIGIVAYRPERWTTEQWTEAYGAGQLGYYGDLDELARYSVLVGYLGWFAAAEPGRRPRVLDVGCGVGLLRERLDGVAIGGYVGVDLSGTAIEEAAGKGFADSQFVVGDAAELALGTFDVVVLNEVLYYAPDAAAFLERLRPATSADGLVLVSMWRHPGDRTLWKLLDRTFILVDRVEVRNPGNPVNAKGWLVGAYRPVRP